MFSLTEGPSRHFWLSFWPRPKSLHHLHFSLVFWRGFVQTSRPKGMCWEEQLVWRLLRCFDPRGLSLSKFCSMATCALIALTFMFIASLSFVWMLPSIVGTVKVSLEGCVFCFAQLDPKEGGSNFRLKRPDRHIGKAFHGWDSGDSHQGWGLRCCLGGSAAKKRVLQLVTSGQAADLGMKIRKDGIWYVYPELT